MSPVGNELRSQTNFGPMAHLIPSTRATSLKGPLENGRLVLGGFGALDLLQFDPSLVAWGPPQCGPWLVATTTARHPTSFTRSRS